jgi:DNA-binding LacI/PurR family transcriptional regulator
VLGHVDPIGYSFRAYLYAELMELSILKNVPALTFPTPSGESGLGISGEMIRSCDNSNEYDIKGIFILDSDHYLYGVKLAEAFPGIRFFFLNYEREDFYKMPSNMAAIVDDNYGGSRQLAESVFKEYHPKSIVYLNCPLKGGDITYQERERGVLDTAKKCGVKCFPTIEVPRSSYSLDQIDFAYEAFGKFLKTKKVDFMFAPNLHLARGVRKVIEEMGLSDEIGVAGYGGFDYSAEERISTVHSPLREMCQRGFSEMLNPEFRMPQVIKLMPEIIVCSKPEVSNKKHSK